ncbi:hypothetical protein Esti_003676 [Eimeria stiedai]
MGDLQQHQLLQQMQLQKQQQQQQMTLAALRPMSVSAEGSYPWLPPVSASAPAGAALAGPSSLGGPMGASSLGGPLGAPSAEDSSSSRRAVRLINLKPMRELRILLPEPQEVGFGGAEEEGPQTVGLKLLPAGGSAESRQGSRSLRGSAPPAGGSGAGGGGAPAGAGGPAAAAAAGAALAAAAAAAGTAEVFGLELLPDVEVELPPAARLAVFTWGGCLLQVRGPVQQEYESSDVAMRFLANLSAALDARRRAAAVKQSVLVTGSSGSGKSSVCQILCNYALRSGWTPFFVELDIRGSCDKRAIEMPAGCIGCCVCRSLGTDEPEDPLVYFVGSSSSASAATGSSSSSSSGAGAAAVRLSPPRPPLVDSEEVMQEAAAAAAAGDSLGGDSGGGEGRSTMGPGDITSEYFPWVCSCLSSAVYSAFAQPPLVLDPRRAALLCGRHMSSRALPATAAVAAAAAGLIANAPHQPSLQQLQQLVEIFGFDVIVVLDHPSLSHDLAGMYGHVLPDTAEEAAAQLQQQLQQQQQQQQQLGAAAAPLGSARRVEVIPLPKLEGTVAPDAARLRVLRRLWLWRYIFGSSQRLPPETLRVSLSQCTLLQLRHKTALPLSALPADSSAAEASPLQLGLWRGPASALLNSILAVPSTRDLQALPRASVACLVHVCGVEADGEEQVLLLRVPGGMGEALAAPLLLVPHDLPTRQHHQQQQQQQQRQQQHSSGALLLPFATD